MAQCCTLLDVHIICVWPFGNKSVTWKCIFSKALASRSVYVYRQPIYTVTAKCVCVTLYHVWVLIYVMNRNRITTATRRWEIISCKISMQTDISFRFEIRGSTNSFLWVWCMYIQCMPPINGSHCLPAFNSIVYHICIWHGPKNTQKYFASTFEHTRRTVVAVVVGIKVPLNKTTGPIWVY